MAQEKTWLALNGTVISFPLQCIILQEQSLTDTEVFSFNQFVSLEWKNELTPVSLGWFIAYWPAGLKVYKSEG